MKSAIGAAFLAALLAGWTATASAFAREGVRGEARALAQSSSSQDCASLAQEERQARRLGDRWRADELQDEYETECLDRGR